MERKDEVADPGGYGKKEEACEYRYFIIPAEPPREVIHEENTERYDKRRKEFHRPVYGVVRLAEHTHHNLIALRVWLIVLHRIIGDGKSLILADVMSDSRIPPGIGIFEIVIPERTAHVHLHGDRKEYQHEDRIPEFPALPTLKQGGPSFPGCKRGKWLVSENGSD